MKLIYFSHGEDGNLDEALVEDGGIVTRINESDFKWEELMEELEKKYND